MKYAKPSRRWLIAVTFAALLNAGTAGAGNILFIGNSFTFAFGSPVRYYRPDTVIDLNSDGQGGVPALFKSFTFQAGLSYEVYLETAPGIGLDWHIQHKLATIEQKPWDAVVMHGYSTLDPKKPGDPKVLVDSVRELTRILKTHNSHVEVRIMATWPRADQTYEAGGAWYGKPIEVMAKDVRSGYDEAAAATPAIKAVIPVGDAWIRAMHAGVADSNPGRIESGKMNLWAEDNYHASVYGSYLEALVIFGSVTGIDPRVLGSGECSAYELRLSAVQTGALQQVAFDQLAAEGTLKAAPSKALGPAPDRCATPLVNGYGFFAW